MHRNQVVTAFSLGLRSRKTKCNEVVFGLIQDSAGDERCDTHYSESFFTYPLPVKQFLTWDLLVSCNNQLALVLVLSL